jgi:hypothetical protein
MQNILDFDGLDPKSFAFDSPKCKIVALDRWSLPSRLALWNGGGYLTDLICPRSI